MSDRLLNQKQMAARLGVSTETMRRLVKAGAVTPIKVGTVVRYDPNQIIKRT